MATVVVSPGVAFAFASPGFPVRGGPAAGGQSPSDSERKLLSGEPRGPWAITDSLREFQPSWRVRECGHWVQFGQPNVQVRESDAGWSFGHIHRCGNPWSCPTCAHAISKHRAREVAQAVDWWRSQDDSGYADVVLLTLTVRHHPADDLRTLRSAMSKVWREVEQGRLWRKFRKVCGVAHHIRCQEVTDGDNGWHPHLHVLLFCRSPQFALPWQEDMMLEWRKRIGKELGARCLPSKRRALDMRACDDERYIAKMGLEVGAPGCKHAKDGHRTAMQLAAELAKSKGAKREQLGKRWKEYASAMHGAHQLHWSQHLRKALGVAISDAQILARPDYPLRPVLAEIPRETWVDMASNVGLGPIAALGCKVHGCTETFQREELLAFFRKLQDQPCGWILRGGTLRLQWRAPPN